MRLLLGVDLGERRIGLALGDATTGIARPLRTIARRTPDDDVANLRTLVRELGIEGLVVGLPLLPGGAEGAQAVRTRAWAKVVGPALGLPVTWQDERFTSLIAEARLGGPGRGRSGGPPTSKQTRDRRARIDREAATAILQAALDRGVQATPTATAEAASR